MASDSTRSSLELAMNHTTRFTNLTPVDVLCNGRDSTVVKAMGSDGKEYACKLDVRNSNNLSKEYSIYNVLKLAGVTQGIPETYRFEKEGETNVIVMQCLGPSMKSLMNDGHRHVALSEEEALQMGVDVLKILKRVHSAGVVHCDIALRNILRGKPGSSEENSHFLVDFGMSHAFEENRDDTFLDGTRTFREITFTQYCHADIRNLFNCVRRLYMQTGNSLADMRQRVSVVREYLRSLEDSDAVDYHVMEQYLRADTADHEKKTQDA